MNQVINDGERQRAKEGYYIFVADSPKKKAEFIIRYENATWYRRYTEYWMTEPVFRHPNEIPSEVSVKGGKAMYIGLDGYEWLSKLRQFQNMDFSFDGKVVEQNDILTLKIHYHNSQKQLFCGPIDLALEDELIYSVNGIYFWVGDVRPLTIKQIEEIDFYDGTEVLKDKKRLNYHSDHATYMLHLSDVPRNGIEITRISCNRLYVYKATDKAHYEKFEKAEKLIRETIEKCKELGICLGKDTEKLVKYALETPDFAIQEGKILVDFLTNETHIDKDREFKFEVERTYGKHYYVVAALADKALSVEVKDEETWYVSFTGEQVYELELMMYMFYAGENIEARFWRDLYKYLMQASVLARLLFGSERTELHIYEDEGYDPHITNSLFIDIIKAVRKIYLSEVDKLYAQMAKEKRIAAKWKNEYRLFSIISSLCDEAVYQYHTEWLGKQSFDIFLEQQKIAIEYQGAQHYQAESFFGGSDRLAENQERDVRKRRIANENGVRLLEWSYLVPVNMENVLSFLRVNGVNFEVDDNRKKESKETLGMIMAPVILEEKKPRHKNERTPRESDYVIRKYGMDGRYISEYESVKQAADDIGLSVTSINKCLYGQRSVAGGYRWTKNIKNQVPEDLEPVQEPERQVQYEAISIIQLDKEGNQIGEYDSISQASRTLGINIKSIRDAVNGRQKTAGGYCWKKKKNTREECRTSLK